MAYRFGLGDRLVSGLTSVAGVVVVLVEEVAAAFVAGADGGAVA